VKQLEKGLAVGIVNKYLFRPPAPVHDMIPGTRIFYAQRSGHENLLSPSRAKAKSELDPFPLRSKNSLFCLLKADFSRETTSQEGIFRKPERSSPNQPGISPHAKKIFSIEMTGPVRDRACSTNGSDCGSLRSHNLTLFVRC
jgi:hypothetical protein